MQWDHLMEFLVFPDVSQESFLHPVSWGSADDLQVREVGLEEEGAELCQLSWALGKGRFHPSFPLTSWVALAVSPQHCPQVSAVGAVVSGPSSVAPALVVGVESQKGLG